MLVAITVVTDGKSIFSLICRRLLFFSAIVFSRPGGFGARDYRNPAQIRGNRGGGGGGGRGGNASGGYNNYQQQWDASNGGSGGNMRGGDRQAGGYDRYQQQAAGGNNNRQVDQSWWDSTS